jgi:hypothetical protein
MLQNEVTRLSTDFRRFAGEVSSLQSAICDLQSAIYNLLRQELRHFWKKFLFWKHQLNKSCPIRLLNNFQRNSVNFGTKFWFRNGKFQRYHPLWLHFIPSHPNSVLVSITSRFSFAPIRHRFRSGYDWKLGKISYPALHPDSVAVMIESSAGNSSGALNIPSKRCVAFQIHIHSKCCIGNQYHWIFSDVYFPFDDKGSFFHQKVELVNTTVYSTVLAFLRFPDFLLLLA